MLAGPDGRAGEAFGVAIGARHQLANVRGPFEDRLLPRVGIERLTLLDAERDERCQRDAVALHRRLLVDDARDDLPVMQSAWLLARPFASLRPDVLRNVLRVVALGVRIVADLPQEGRGLRLVGIEAALAGPDIVGRRAEDIITLGLQVGIVGAEDEELAALRLLRPSAPVSVIGRCQ